MQTKFKVYPFQSTEYLLALLLRYKILRVPLGLTFSAQDLAKDQSDFHLGLFEGETLLACLILTPQAEGKMKMRQVAVDEHLQGTGIGSELVRFSEGFAREKGFTYIHCNARKTAVPFYLKHGYTISGDEFSEVGIPHYYMEKELSVNSGQ